MTAKRFECDKGSRIIIDNETKLHYIMSLDWECSLVTKLLNSFVEENEQLRTKNNAYIQDIEVFKEENTHIKTTLNNMIETERTELGRSVLKQLKEQIK